MRSIFIVLIASIFLVACSVTKTLKPYDFSSYKSSFTGRAGQAPEVTQSFNASYDAVWEAAVNVVREMGHPLRTIDKKSGIFTTEWLPRGGAPFVIGTPWDHFRDRFSVNIVEQGGSVEVGVRRTIEVKDDDEYETKTSDQEIEKWFLEQIRKAVE